MRVGLDLDGVTFDFDAGWRSQYRRWFGADLPADGAWNSIVSQTHFDSEEQFWAWVDDVPGFWLDMPPIDGAFGGIRTLLAGGVQIAIVTHRHEKARGQTEAALRRYWPVGYAWPEVHLTKRKTDVAVQVYVDDNPKVLAHFDRVQRPYVKFAQPWNKEHKSKLRAANWQELVPLLLEMKEALA